MVRAVVTDALTDNRRHDLLDLKQVAKRYRVGREAIVAAAKRGEIALSQRSSAGRFLAHSANPNTIFSNPPRAVASIVAFFLRTHQLLQLPQLALRDLQRLRRVHAAVKASPTHMRSAI
jgi:hypothetical protein